MTADTRERIRSAALDEFCDKGYGACVDDIARRAGVVKQTLYHHYGSKDRLFREVLNGLVEELLIDLERQGGSLRENLLRFAQAYRNRILGEQGLALHRMMVAESPRFPELSAAVFEAGNLLVSHGLVQLLRDAMARGELRTDDPEFVADMLLSMLAGQEHNRRLLGLTTPGHPGGWPMEQTIDCFLRAFAPPPSSERVQGKKK